LKHYHQRFLSYLSLSSPSFCLFLEWVFVYPQIFFRSLLQLSLVCAGLLRFDFLPWHCFVLYILIIDPWRIIHDMYCLLMLMLCWWLSYFRVCALFSTVPGRTLGMLVFLLVHPFTCVCDPNCVPYQRLVQTRSRNDTKQIRHGRIKIAKCCCCCRRIRCCCWLLVCCGRPPYSWWMDNAIPRNATLFHTGSEYDTDVIPLAQLRSGLRLTTTTTTAKTCYWRIDEYTPNKRRDVVDCVP